MGHPARRRGGHPRTERVGAPPHGDRVGAPPDGVWGGRPLPGRIRTSPTTPRGAVTVVARPPGIAGQPSTARPGADDDRGTEVVVGRYTGPQAAAGQDGGRGARLPFAGLHQE